MTIATPPPWRATSAEASPGATGETPVTRPETWVVLPTYDEAENIGPIIARILTYVPAAHILVVDDASPDGTGAVADALAARDARIEVLHRAGKEGLGAAYLAGFAVALGRGADIVVQMDADGSHDPTSLPMLIAPVATGRADMVIGSRYTTGGRVVDWGLRRRLISRGGSLYARSVLGLPVRDLTGGFKVWRATALRAIDAADVKGGGYVFQIEMTCRAFDAGARVAEVPITFRDRKYGVSKMDGRIVREALLLVLRLGWERRIGQARGAEHPHRASRHLRARRLRPRRHARAMHTRTGT